MRYRGTAIALQLGHRESEDFDFFARSPVDPERLLNTLPLLAGREPVQVEPDTLTTRVDRNASCDCRPSASWDCPCCAHPR